jgi:D-alanyl-D-alanine carboxypeptidase (penicillin-binding protein 5/6)
MARVWIALWLSCWVLSALAATRPVPAPPALEARSYILMDADSGAVLAERDADTPHGPASITKLMTAYVVFKALREGHIGWDDRVEVSERAWGSRVEGSKMFIRVGKRVPVRDLLRGMIVASGNDASIALAEHVAGTEAAFAELMNAEAKAMGLKNSHFVNSTGLPHPDHYMSARDIAILSLHLIRDFPEEYKMFGEKEYTTPVEYSGGRKPITQPNRNRLLWKDASVDGLKTGHTEEAGYCLAASALRDGMRLISVVMGTSGDRKRTAESQALLSYGFRNFETHKLFEAGETLANLRVWKGETETVPAGVPEALYVTVPKGRYDDLEARTEPQGRVMAPVVKGQRLGDVVVRLDGRELRRVPLVALRDDPEGGLWRLAVDTVLLWFE